MRKRLEKSIEGAVCAFAKNNGVEVVKLQGMGKRSLPDRMFLGAGGTVLFIEFKREGEKPTPLQAALHARWRALGHRVYVIDDVAAGKKLLMHKLHNRIDMKYPLEDR